MDPGLLSVLKVEGVIPQSILEGFEIVPMNVIAPSLLEEPTLFAHEQDEVDSETLSMIPHTGVTISPRDIDLCLSLSPNLTPE